MYHKICSICGKPFDTEDGRKRSCSSVHYFPCPVCGKPVEYKNKNKHRCCSVECAAKKRNETKKKKYGDNWHANKEYRKKKKCLLCGEYFIATHSTQKICKKTHYFPCPICGKPVEYKYGNKSRCCSKECSEQKYRQTCIHRYGVDNAAKSNEVKEAIRNTNLEKYGATSFTKTEMYRMKTQQTDMMKYGVTSHARAKSVKDKRKLTCLDKYGVDHPSKSDVVKEKKQQTSLRKYGVPHHWMDSSVQKAREETWLKKYGVNNPSKCDYVVHKIQNTLNTRYGVSSAAKLDEVKDKIQATNMKKYGVPWYTLSKDIRLSRMSDNEQQFLNMCNHYNLSVDREYVIEDVSYDFIVNDTLVEIDPTISHNAYKNFWTGEVYDCNTRKDRRYLQFNKTHIAELHGYKCVHVFQWDDLNYIFDIIINTNVVVTNGLVDRSKFNTVACTSRNYRVLESVEPVAMWSKLKGTTCYNSEEASTNLLPVYNCGYLRVMYDK